MAIISIHPKNPQQRVIDKCSQVLENGGIIAYPSDTTYALAADIFNKKAVENLYNIKKMDKSKLFSCICYDFSVLSHYAHISNNAYRIMKHLLPGPFTFILQGKSNLPKITLTKRKTIGVRMPDNIIVKELYSSFKKPFLSCGIKLSEDVVLNNPKEIEKDIGHMLSLVVDGGNVNFAPSTIISLLNEDPEIIRIGSGDISYFK